MKLVTLTEISLILTFFLALNLASAENVKIGAKNTYSEIPTTYDCNPSSFCPRIDYGSKTEDYEGELTFDLSTIPSTATVTSASICAYVYKWYGAEDLNQNSVTVQKITSSDCSKAYPVSTSPTSIGSGVAEHMEGWQCIRIWTLSEVPVSKDFYVRLWGEDLDGKTKPYSCYRGPNARLSICGGSNPSGASDCRPYIDVTYTVNNPPNTPSQPSGSASGLVGTSYTYSTSATDPNGDQIKYGWDWDGDNIVDEWSDFMASGATDTRAHSWSTAGTYSVKVKAEDQSGAQSDLSNALIVAIVGEISLKPGTLQFTSESIVPYPVTAEGDVLGLYGDLTYLNVYWNAVYFSGRTDINLGVKCYLNCDAGDDIKTNCEDKPEIQRCGYPMPPGEGICTIINPIYNFKAANKVTCNFYTPSSIPPEQFKPYIERAFKPIDLEISTTASITVKLGESFSLPISVKNIGLFTDSYKINITAFTPNLVSIDRGLITTDKIKTRETAKVSPTITVLATTGPARIGVWAYSTNENNPTCSAKEDCSYMGANYDCETTSGMCSRYSLIEIKSGVASLPEFGWLGVLQIMLLAVVVFAVINLKMIVRK